MKKKYLAKIIANDNQGLQMISACCTGSKVKITDIKDTTSISIPLLLNDLDSLPEEDIFDDQEIIQKPSNANWDEIDSEFLHDDLKLKKALLEKFKIPIKNSEYTPEKGVSFKPLVLLFDEIYTENFRFNQSLSWMENCSKMIFMGTSFSVNITNIALEIAVEKNLPIGPFAESFIFFSIVK